MSFLVLDISGPFYGEENDASIMKKTLANSNLMRLYDIFVVDRLFRDVVGEIEGKGFRVLMPAFKGKKAQLDTEEANESRKITKISWVVEAVHGSIAKKYELFHPGQQISQQIW